MPKQAFLAAVEGMPNFNRRTFLRGMGSATAVAGVAAAPTITEASATVAVPENEELQRLGQLLADYLAERTAAGVEIKRIADEWRDRWPLAPEALLGPPIGGRARDDAMWRAERDITGKVLDRDVSLLTKRLTRRRRTELAGRRLAFYVESRTSIVDTLTNWREREPAGRSPKALERNRAWRAENIALAQTRLDLVDQYEAETAHLREVSGMNAAKARMARAEHNIVSVRAAISLAEAFSPAELRMKAEVVLDELSEHAFNLVEVFPDSVITRLHNLALAVAGGRAIS